MIKGSMVKHTAGWLKKVMNEKKADCTISVQRKEVWDIAHKSNLIGAMLIGVPIESLLFEEDGDDSYLVLDGQQRSLAISQFLNNKYPISETCKIKEVGGVNIVGKYFNDLPENLQEELKEFELSISLLRPLSEDERETVFFMRNQAVALTKVELTRVLMGSKAMEIVNLLCLHPFITEKINVSQSALNHYQDQQIIMECSILETGKDYSFSGKDLMKFAEEIRAEEGVTTELGKTMVTVFDYLNNAVQKKNRSLRKMHIPMLYAVAKRALKDNVSPEAFSQWMSKFFFDIKGDDSEYAVACNSGSNQKTNVQKRLSEMINHYELNKASL